MERSQAHHHSTQPVAFLATTSDRDNERFGNWFLLGHPPVFATAADQTFSRVLEQLASLRDIAS
jgi:hypothetical protein